MGFSQGIGLGKPDAAAGEIAIDERWIRVRSSPESTLQRINFAASQFCSKYKVKTNRQNSKAGVNIINLM